MTEISNKTLALLVLATLAVVVTATSIQLGGFTGLSTGSGDVILDISDNLEIEVTGDINFGSCTPNSSGTYTLDSKLGDTQANISNCDGTDNLGASGANITIANIGNIQADVTVYPECNVEDWLNPGTFEVDTSEGTTTCGTDTAGYTTLHLGGSGNAINACTGLDVSSEFYLYSRVTIEPTTSDAQSCGSGDSTNTLTFTATQA